MTSLSVCTDVWAAPPTTDRVLALAPGGQRIAARTAGVVRILDARGERAAVDVVEDGDVRDFIWSGERLWLLRAGTIAVHGADGELLAAGDIDLAHAAIRPAPAAGGVLITGGGEPVLATLQDDAVSIKGLGAREGDEEVLASLGGLRTLRAGGRHVRITDPGRELQRFRLPGTGTVASAVEILGGAALAIASRTGSGQVIDVVRVPGGLVHHIAIEGARELAFAPACGLAVASTDAGELVAINLRYGQITGRVPAPLPGGRHIDLDERGTFVAVAGHRTEGADLSIFRLDFAELFAGAPVSLEVAENKPEIEDDPTTPSPLTPRAEREPRAEAPAAPPTELDVTGFAPGGGRSSLDAVARRALLDAELDYLRTVMARVVADKWREGALARPDCDLFPHESEVVGLVGAAQPEIDPDALSRRLEQLDSRVDATWQTLELARLSCQATSPLDELGARFGLDAGERALVMAIAAPAIDGPARRLCEIATGGEGSATEELLGRMLHIMVPTADASLRLHPGSRLASAGLLVRPGPRRTDPIEPAPAVLELLEAGLDRPKSDVGIARYRIPEAVWLTLRDVLEGESAPRLVLRGRPGRGRRALAAHLASRAGNVVSLIDVGCSGGDLAAELSRARILGTVPCLVGLDDASPLGAAEARAIEESPGMLLACVGEDSPSPLEPGAPVIDLGRLGEPERRGLWLDLLGAEQAEAAAGLARRYSVPPALAIDVAAHAGRCPDRIARSLSLVLSQRLRSLADPVTDLPFWDNVILPDEIADSLREVIGRQRHFDRLAHEWGMASALRSARGVVALFAGPPGTGKTLAAGLVARELGRDLYRVDVSRIVSKWLGETEKKLAAIFDAAEQADAVLLFDEADSLFARRTAVKSSNDRYANLEVNYLLQRIETFRGVAILTTNQGSAVDPAFRRRLTCQLTFSLPDSEMREALWRAHLPPQVPSAGDIDFAALAEGYPLSGGNIRNIAVRAAFLSAAEESPLSASHIERALRLTYSERGKLSPSGRLE
jgi:hypothetical protein